MPSETEKFLGLRSESLAVTRSAASRILGTAFFIWCILVAVGILMVPLFVILAYGSAMAAFGPHYSGSQPSPFLTTVGFLLIGIPQQIAHVLHLEFPADLLVPRQPSNDG